MKQIMRSLFLTLLGLILSLSIHAMQPIKAQLPASTQNTALAFVEAGKNHYDAGQFSAAIRALQQAAQTYEAAGDKIKQAQTLSLLSLAYQKLGQWQAAATAIDASLSLLNSQSGSNQKVRAQVLNAQGHLQLATGKADAALETWQQAAAFYASAKDEVGVLGSQINQAEAMQALGLYRRTEKLFAQIEQKLQAQPDSHLKATGLRNLGKLLRLSGDLDESRSLSEIKAASKQLYDWLIKPLETDLKNFFQPNQIKTLVFVIDSSLRNIPPPALYNGQQYLIEKSAIVDNRIVKFT